jgi:hypothetical protein
VEASANSGLEGFSIGLVDRKIRSYRDGQSVRLKCSDRMGDSDKFAMSDLNLLIVQENEESDDNSLSLPIALIQRQMSNILLSIQRVI